LQTHVISGAAFEGVSSVLRLITRRFSPSVQQNSAGNRSLSAKPHSRMFECVYPLRAVGPIKTKLTGLANIAIQWRRGWDSPPIRPAIPEKQEFLVNLYSHSGNYDTRRYTTRDTWISRTSFSLRCGGAKLPDRVAYGARQPQLPDPEDRVDP
jgi:hypothetical protein